MKRQLVTLEELERVPVPFETSTYHPLPYTQGIEMVMQAAEPILTPQGFKYQSSRFEMAREGRVMAGDIMYSHAMGGLYAAVHLVNSYDKTIAFQVTAALVVQVCLNGMHMPHGAQVFCVRKHTPMIREDAPHLIEQAITQVPDVFESGVLARRRFKETPISTGEAYQLIFEGLDKNIISPSMILPIRADYLYPQQEEFEPGSMWGLYNAFTQHMKKLPIESSVQAHRGLHEMIEGHVLRVM